MKIKTQLIFQKIRRKNWALMIFPSLFIGRYYDGFNISFSWLMFEISIDSFSNENVKN